jgi:hypothetical protein
MRFGVAIALVLFAPAVALAHGPCNCLSRNSGPHGTEVRLKGGWTAYRVIWNGGGFHNDRQIRRLRRPGVRTIELVRLPRARRGVRFQIPPAPPGVYPVVIYDGSEGGFHYTWALFRVRR